MIEALRSMFDATQTWLFEHVVQPLVFNLGWMSYQEDAYVGTEWFLLGLIQVVVVYALLRPLETRFPAEAWADRRGVGVDILYTLLHRLGAFPLLMFLLLTPVADWAGAHLRAFGFTTMNLDALWPGMTDRPLVSFATYVVVLDFVDYWVHRAQHRWRWWWGLHSLHHSQRKMSLWSDDRNHLLDDVILNSIKVIFALLIGVEPAQFVGLIILTRALQSLQHANLKWSLGPLGRVTVSPVFHRRHHAIGLGHEGRRYGCNFSVLLPIWDVMFGTADWRRVAEPTGVRDQLPSPTGMARDYGSGFWRQQWLGLKRMVGAPGA